MPGFLLNFTAPATCPHGGKISLAGPPKQVQLTVPGGFVAVATDVFTVAGCLFQVPVPGGTKPQPCVTVKWANISTKVTITGQPALLQSAPGAGNGVCLSVEGIPQGPPVLATLNPKATAT
jgi:hypothetical protein